MWMRPLRGGRLRTGKPPRTRPWDGDSTPALTTLTAPKVHQHPSTPVKYQISVIPESGFRYRFRPCLWTHAARPPARKIHEFGRSGERKTYWRYIFRHADLPPRHKHTQTGSREMLSLLPITPTY